MQNICVLCELHSSSKMIHVCDWVYDTVLAQSLRQPWSSKPLKEFVQDECKGLLLEYGDNNPLVRAHRDECKKWEDAFKALQVALLVELHCGVFFVLTLSVCMCAGGVQKCTRESCQRDEGCARGDQDASREACNAAWESHVRYEQKRDPYAIWI